MSVATLPAPAGAPAHSPGQNGTKHLIVCDPGVADDLKSTRALRGLDTYDEVWEGVPVIMSLPNDEHQEIVQNFCVVPSAVLGHPGPHRIRPGVNVSDRAADWKENYRCPDVVVYLQGNASVNHGTHWQGGPDFLVEIVSPGDPTWDKLPFYASVNSREVLVIDRDPWQLELYQLQGGQMIRAGQSDLNKADVLTSSLLPVTIQLVAGTTRPHIEVVQPATGQRWLV